jgi:NADH-quinone oxidoreductase subunit J
VTLPLLLFLVAAAVAFVCALAIAFHPNPMVSATSMAVAMVTLGALYIALGVPFLGFFQIIVYAGAVMVIVLYVIMALGQEEEGPPVGGPQWYGTMVAAGLFLFQAVSLLRVTRAGRMVAVEPDYGSIKQFGGLLIKRFAVPFELASVLLVGAMVGAVVLSRRRME